MDDVCCECWGVMWSLVAFVSLNEKVGAFVVVVYGYRRIAKDITW